MSQKQIKITLPGGLLGFVFIVLKCTGYINWPWLWVLCPFWIPLAFLAAIGLMMVALSTVAALTWSAIEFVKWLKRRYKRSLK